MDEILIGDKKYISSKQAAKVTGYAKDYIGQLCREGRVPARLVGRSWYVLESALHDHRFGEQKTESEKMTPHSLRETWDAPRYETASVEVIPLVAQKEEVEVMSLRSNEPAPDLSSVSEHLQDAWKSWFNRVTEPEEVGVPVEPVRSEEPAEEIEEPVAIRAVYHQPPKELLPHPTLEEELIRDRVILPEHSSPVGRFFGAIQLVGATLALLALLTAAAGSGYFDRYVIANRQVSSLAGVILYNK
jgi:hypothetical protein